MLHFPTLARPVPADIASVCVFGGVHSGRDRCLAAATAALGRCIGHAGLRLVYGGGDAGLMACAARAAHEYGSEIVAIAPRFFTERVDWTEPLDQEIVVPDMAMRNREARPSNHREQVSGLKTQTVDLPRLEPPTGEPERRSR